MESEKYTTLSDEVGYSNRKECVGLSFGVYSSAVMLVKIVMIEKE